MPGVLKGGATVRSPGEPDRARGEEQREARCRAALAEAEERAADLVRTAAQDAERLRAEAVESGRLEGRSLAASELLSAAAARDRLLAEAREELVELALAVAEKLLRRVLAGDREAVRSLAEAALREARGRRVVRLRIHPDDVAALAPDLDGLAGARGVELLADPGLRPGDAVAETEAGVADARIETQLAALRRALREAR